MGMYYNAKKKKEGNNEIKLRRRWKHACCNCTVPCNYHHPVLTDGVWICHSTLWAALIAVFGHFHLLSSSSSSYGVTSFLRYISIVFRWQRPLMVCVLVMSRLRVDQPPVNNPAVVSWWDTWLTIKGRPSSSFEKIGMKLQSKSKPVERITHINTSRK